ncbi:hypothetical protein [Sphingomonas sp.]|jgi:hypothetical protein|uniref:hypothetical protein n=1 Tax=Sphingomonas sp. TaxID=28214 RepID=UPI003564EC5B
MTSISPLFWSPSTGGFYHAEIHGADMPEDAQRITATRHAALLEGQATGRQIVTGANGKPALTAMRTPTKAQVVERTIAAIKAQARRRILAIASLERQANDAAAIATHLLSAGTDATELQAALDRRRRIDAIRAASNALEAMISTWSLAALATFDASADAHWPTDAQE